MFKNKDLSKYKQKKKKFEKKNLNDLRTYLNVWEYREFLTLYVPKGEEEVKIILKPLPFINDNEDDIGGLYIPFSKHLSKDIKLNCKKNISSYCPICSNSSIKKYDFVIFPVYIIHHSHNNYIKNQIKLIEIPFDEWEKNVDPYIDKFYQDDLILHIHLKKDQYFHRNVYSREKYLTEELTEDLVLKKCFKYNNIKNQLYNKKCYVKEFELETSKTSVIVSGIDF